MGTPRHSHDADELRPTDASTQLAAQALPVGGVLLPVIGQINGTDQNTSHPATSADEKRRTDQPVTVSPLGRTGNDRPVADGSAAVSTETADSIDEKKRGGDSDDGLEDGDADVDEALRRRRERDFELDGNQRQETAPGLTDWLLGRTKLAVDLDAVATQPSVFDDPEQAKHYQPHPKWENLHRFDPSCRWTWREEQKVIRKNDQYITAWAVLMFFCLELDRGNISQANSDNLLKDLGLTRGDYNLGNTLFRLSFLLAELPSQMISKRIGSDVWVPTQVTLWSAFSMAQFAMRGRGTFLFFRVMIGALQGGFIADQCLYLSYFYKKTELPVRLAFFWMSNALVDLISPFLAFGILRMRGVGGYAGWRWLFLFEGLLTLVVGLFSFVMMPSSPTTSKTWFWRKGWYSEREEYIQINRVIRDDPSKGSMHNRQGLTLRQIWKSGTEVNLWPLYLLGFTFGMGDYPVTSYFTLTLRSLGFDTFQTNLLSMPCAAIAAVTLVAVTVASERFNTRAFIGMAQNVWYLPGFVALYTLPSSANKWSFWGVMTYILSAPIVHAINVGWVSRQSGSVQTRTVSTALYNMFRQLSAIAGSNVYAPSDAPLYRRGNLGMTILSCANILLYFLTWCFYRVINARRDRKWRNMTKTEKLHYLDTTRDAGQDRLDFRYAY